jgi:hypothetical protein
MEWRNSHPAGLERRRSLAFTTGGFKLANLSPLAADHAAPWPPACSSQFRHAGRQGMPPDWAETSGLVDDHRRAHPGDRRWYAPRCAGERRIRLTRSSAWPALAVISLLGILAWLPRLPPAAHRKDDLTSSHSGVPVVFPGDCSDCERWDRVSCQSGAVAITCPCLPTSPRAARTEGPDPWY